MPSDQVTVSKIYVENLPFLDLPWGNCGFFPQLSSFPRQPTVMTYNSIGTMVKFGLGLCGHPTVEMAIKLRGTLVVVVDPKPTDSLYVYKC